MAASCSSFCIVLNSVLLRWGPFLRRPTGRGPWQGLSFVLLFVSSFSGGPIVDGCILVDPRIEGCYSCSARAAIPVQLVTRAKNVLGSNNAEQTIIQELVR